MLSGPGRRIPLPSIAAVSRSEQGVDRAADSLDQRLEAVRDLAHLHARFHISVGLALSACFPGSRKVNQTHLKIGNVGTAFPTGLSPKAESCASMSLTLVPYPKARPAASAERPGSTSISQVRSVRYETAVLNA